MNSSQPILSPVLGQTLTLTTDGRRTWMVDVSNNPYARFSPRVSFVRASLTSPPTLYATGPQLTDYAAFESAIFTTLGIVMPNGFQPSFTPIVSETVARPIKVKSP
jgi:hypothetical protein